MGVDNGTVPEGAIIGMVLLWEILIPELFTELVDMNATHQSNPAEKMREWRFSVTTLLSITFESPNVLVIYMKLCNCRKAPTLV